MKTFEVLMLKEASGYIRVEAENETKAYRIADHLAYELGEKILEKFIDEPNIDDCYNSMSADEVFLVDGVWTRSEK